jgi:hypothetical protein
VDADIMKKWVAMVLEPRRRKIALNKKGLILLDGHRAHLSEEVINKIKACNFDILVMPPNTTAYLQPLDIAVNRSFKSLYSNEWEDWMSKKKPNDSEKPSKDHIIKWVSRSWEKVREEVVIQGWKPLLEYQGI